MTEQTSGRHARFGAVARYPDVAAAREALTALEQKGLEANRYRLVGPAVQRATEAKSGERALAEDMRSTGSMLRRVVLGGAIGAVLGIAIVLVALLLIDPGLDTAAMVLIAVLGGGAAGSVVFGFIAGETRLPVKGEEWEDTFDPEAEHGGEAAIEVHSDDEGELQKALDALQRTHPTTVERL